MAHSSFPIIHYNLKLRAPTRRLNNINPRTYEQKHTATVVHRGLNGWTPLGLLICYYISKKKLPLAKSLWCALQDEVYFTGYHAAGGL